MKHSLRTALLFTLSMLASIPAAHAYQTTKGELSAVIDRFRAKALTGCDAKNIERMSEISSALDAKASDIDASLKSLPPSENYRGIPFGPITLRERITPYPKPIPGWISESYSWDMIESEYQKLLRNPSNGNWRILSTEVRSILYDDQKRILEDAPYNIHHADSGAIAEQRKYEAIRREGDVLIVPLYAGPFESVKTQVADLIESVWKSPKLRIQIEWRTQPADDIYKMIAGTGAGERAGVRYAARTIELFPDTRTTTIPHEFGHALGFDDHYYTTWNESKCSYECESRGDDVMSESITGTVTSEEWDHLEELYPRSPSAWPSLKR